MWHFLWVVKAEGVLGGRLLQAKMLQLQGQLLSLCLEKIMIFVDSMSTYERMQYLEHLQWVPQDF